MTETLLRILSAAAATLLGLGLWWGMLAVARSMGMGGELASEWSIPVWAGFGLMVISLNRILENLLIQPE
ncbi:MAG: hypothetical protein KAT39_00690 [Alphaproteobacteria bacterium]|nr:hypothetical protein [Alphaproteobacteria bacterium]